MTNEYLSLSSGSPKHELNISTSSKSYSETNPISPKISHSQMTPTSSTCVSPVTFVDTNRHKRQRDDSCEKDETSSSSNQPPCKTAKMGYSIMNLLGKDVKDKDNKENDLESRPISPPQVNPAPLNQQNLNPFLLNPFFAAAAAAAQNGQSNLLSNISNLAMLSKNQPQEMWPWFNMAAMSALYGLDKGYSNLFQAPIDNSSQLRNTLPTIGQQNLIQQKNNDDSDEHYQTPNRIGNLNKTSTPHNFIANYQRNILRPNEPNRSQSSSSSSSISPPVNGNLIENRKLLNRSLDDEEREEEINLHNSNRIGFSGASMGDDDDLDDDNDAGDEDDDLDGSNNGDSFDNMRKKKTRTVFSRNQVFQLESTFDMKRYLSSSERSSLANSLQLTETQIKIWFQNRRNKWKRQLAAEIESNSSMSNNNNQQQQQQQTQHQLSSGQINSLNNNAQRNSTSNQQQQQRVVRVPVLYQSADNGRSYIGQEIEANIQSSSSSTHSSLTSPSSSNFNNQAVAAVLSNMANSNPNQGSVNPASLLSPSMLAAAAAASSLYYAAAAQGQQTQFPSLNLNLANIANGSKQSLSSIL
ncbi:unnamed protein product [Brachionus calyciflorus]|uniref:Homeobox domain-containing protein n=1 Tax=Brachionus calyciflorus TaxID=104777 RepID=A0A813PE63_9BILA|nr:unnamed protein product [Brachionus calyciflorus]